MSCHAMSRRVVSCRAVPCRCRAVSCRAVSCRVVLCRVVSCKYGWLKKKNRNTNDGFGYCFFTINGIYNDKQSIYIYMYVCVWVARGINQPSPIAGLSYSW